jgi:uncharacterized repeat protein (TIGR01451 family)
MGFQDFANPPTPNTCDVGGIYVYRSSDGGQTWTLPAGAPAILNTQTIFRDKEYIAVDSNPLSPHAGTVYMVWDDDQYLACPHDFNTNFDVRRIMFSKSIDGGATWSAPVTLATGCLVTAIPTVGSDGALRVVWYDCNSAGNPRQLVRTSTDGGVSFGGAVAAAASGFTDCPNPLPGASFRVNAAFPAIATDPTNATRVYVVWSSCTVAGQADVFLARSTDGGGTWSAPLRVNDDATSNPRDQFMPWLTVDDQGDVLVMWGDDRLDTVNAGGHFYDIFSARSTDNGVSFGTNVRVTSVSSNPDFDFGGGFIGDYFGFAPCGTPIWTDTRHGNQDAFAAGLDADANGVADTCAGAPPSGADLSITKSDSPDPVMIGDTLTYALDVSNAGPETASEVIVTDDLPASVTFVSATPTQGTCSHLAGTVTCSIGTLASGGNTTVDIEVTPNSAGLITNTASVSSDTDDPDQTDNSDAEDTTVQAAATGQADLKVRKEDGLDPAKVGRSLPYQIVVRNRGKDVATGVTLVDQLPAGVTFVSATPRQGTCSEVGGIVTCDLGSLARGERTRVKISVTPTAPGTLTNTVEVSANEGDPDTSNNRDIEMTTVRQT